MTFWEFNACAEGYSRAHGVQEAPSGDELDQAFAEHAALEAGI